MGKALAFILYVVMFFGPLWYKIRYILLKPFVTPEKNLGVDEIKKELDALIKNFSYRYDSITELGDSIVPPDYAYNQLRNEKLYDDCDGFHAGVYEMIRKSGYKTCLVTSLNENVMTNHVMVLFKHNADIYLINYNNVIKLSSIDNMGEKEFNVMLAEACSKECRSQSYFRSGQVFTKSRWFKRVNLYKFFK